MCKNYWTVTETRNLIHLLTLIAILVPYSAVC